MSQSSRDCFVYVGTYTRREGQALGKAEGIYTYQLDTLSGKLSHRHTTTGVINPTFLTMDRDHRFLYAASEVEEFKGVAGGVVSAFSVEAGSGKLRDLNCQASNGGAPCYLSIDSTGQMLLVANYSGGSVGAFPRGPDGRLGEQCALIQHEGASVDPDRQTAPRAHCVIPEPGNRFVLAADLGADRIFIYRLDPSAGRLTTHQPSSVELPPGSGPRHVIFHPDLSIVYVINELGSSIVVFAFDKNRGSLKKIQCISTLPDGYDQYNMCADIHLTSCGRFLYGSNRGHHSIAIFAVDSSKGFLKTIGHESTRGATPRNFAIDPNGRYLLAANQDSDNIVTFQIDPRTGGLDFVSEVEVLTPVCLEFGARCSGEV